MEVNFKKTIMLIGGAGYIGTVVANYFLNLKFNAIVYDNLIYGHNHAIKNLSKSLSFITCTSSTKCNTLVCAPPLQCTIP